MRPSRVHVAFVLAAAAAALLPLREPHMADGKALAGFPGWPADIEGRRLMELPMTPREAAFADGFPGRIGRFTDGRREVILRYVASPTRKLHPASDCLRGVGYAVSPLPGKRAADGALMGCFAAVRGEEKLTVCELVRDEHGRSWSDVSAWFWDAFIGVSAAPFWSLVVAERA